MQGIANNDKTIATSIDKEFNPFYRLLSGVSFSLPKRNDHMLTVGSQTHIKDL